MNSETVLPVIKAIIKRFLRIKNSYSSGGSTARSRYCYSVWLRHLSNYYSFTNKIPDKVAELGPGDSLGIGFAALLSGCNELHTLDIVKYWDTNRNLKKFDDLVTLFKTEIDLPNNEEFPNVKPTLNNYSFPKHILTKKVLSESLNEARLNKIRAEISDIENPNNKFIKCHVPWNSADVISNSSLDFIYSQSVLQYITDLELTFTILNDWLKPDGLMSHTIDLSSIGLTNSWNGHWTFTDTEWEILKADRDFIINQFPYSAYLKIHKESGLNILHSKTTEKKSSINRNQLNLKFKNLTEKDLITSDLYILSQKV